MTNGSHCPECGTSYIHGPAGISAKTKKIAAGVVAAVVVLSLAGFGVMGKTRTDQEAAQQAAAAQLANEEAATAEKLANDAADSAAAAESVREAEIAVREESVPEIEASITKMARKHASKGVIDGPILETSCAPVAGGSLDDLTDTTTKFSCLAITNNNRDGTSEGYTYTALMNWDEGTYTYGLGKD